MNANHLVAQILRTHALLLERNTPNCVQAAINSMNKLACQLEDEDELFVYCRDMEVQQRKVPLATF